VLMPPLSLACAYPPLSSAHGPWRE
jgi:hypothetical protein